MEFRTIVNITPFGRKIDHAQAGLSLGSCFAANIAARMKRARFRITDNPFGVLFNPVSIADALHTLSGGRQYTADDLVRNGDIRCSFDFHGSFSSTDVDEAVRAMNMAAGEGSRALRDADYVIITFGTAWVYELAEHPGKVVANCHKFPAQAFTRRRLAVREIVERYDELFGGPLTDKRVIFTVSPVRHVKDGLAENSLSKAILLEAVRELVDKHPAADYFPAFEIVNDELRDYRFYAPDMVHPSEVAVDYIWERFGDAVLSDRARQAAAECEKIAAAMEHRPLNPGSESHAKFLASMLERVNTLAVQYPEIDFSEELDYF